MDDRQRWSDEEEMLRVAIGGMLSQLWTSLPGHIVSYDATSNTATVQIGVQGQLASPDEDPRSVNYPLLVDVPVIFPRGGGCTLTFPITAGDECWVSFACRSMGGWKQSGGIQPPNADRRHSLSDAVCHIGPMSQANKISGISTSTTQLRSNDGSTYVELDPAGKVVNVVAPGGFHVTAPTATFSGLVTAATDVKVGSISLKTHVHSGVQSGPSTTGAPQ